MRTVDAPARPAVDVETAEVAEVAPRRPTAERWLNGLVEFQGVTGTAGGTAFLVAPESGDQWFPEDWLDRIPFDSFVWPGIILGVGLGVGLMAWIVAELVLIPDISWLQPFYFTVGALIVGTCLAPSVREHLRRGVNEEMGT